jgi:hypothetical protein
MARGKQTLESILTQERWQFLSQRSWKAGRKRRLQWTGHIPRDGRNINMGGNLVKSDSYTETEGGE